ncbi:hypothetical protein [Alteromonas macleodii]|uniref:Uncharacterized protein n=1 Tax=Alteromonas macleodii TaxID=28108 RepID=A0AB36FL39_ALTMA|nr:hypothetical protein [Alteromonas macleodii]OES24194.1 hypothetical protein BFV93_4794 [Alteromonas macleodii]OES24826.1 hypothetical protein BFV95_4585 [Alteromonas macleodii]OES25104.1 hypothetical protein BFV94_4575 [Alteromonas macleodii]OES39147.1 hypothetical protein BFV96_4295 [Alteromonas macleodii]
MSRQQDIHEIFSTLDTAFLACLSHHVADLPKGIRNWLIDNKHQMTPNTYQFFCTLSLKQRSFINNLRAWLTQLKKRHVAVSNVFGKSFDEWAHYAGQRLEEQGCAYIVGEDDFELPEDLRNQCIKHGAVIFNPLQSYGEGSRYATMDVLIYSNAHMRTIRRTLDATGIDGDIVVVNEDNGVYQLCAINPNQENTNVKLATCTFPMLAEELGIS